MSPDVLLVTGLVLAVLAVPSMVSALSDGRAPRIAAVVAIAAGGLMVYAINQKPGGYTLSEVPTVFFRVVGGLIN
ncbi:hypothetical protein [Thetidibacter halocola]|uniref:50S ribosomal protein L35 n=1 Tax=Thetidibacter halocola TaxID=2827239 RepID=A0A8J7WEV5_9RHOB|nr:hypothetical protein [Thetidibacter halocola]MBS0125502.1 hypothetical protein [Thetidibacter halocola]